MKLYGTDREYMMIKRVGTAEQILVLSDKTTAVFLC